MIIRQLLIVGVVNLAIVYGTDQEWIIGSFKVSKRPKLSSYTAATSKRKHPLLRDKPITYNNLFATPRPEEKQDEWSFGSHLPLGHLYDMLKRRLGNGGDLLRQPEYQNSMAPSPLSAYQMDGQGDAVNSIATVHRGNTARFMSDPLQRLAHSTGYITNLLREVVPHEALLAWGSSLRRAFKQIYPPNQSVTPEIEEEEDLPSTPAPPWTLQNLGHKMQEWFVTDHDWDNYLVNVLYNNTDLFITRNDTTVDRGPAWGNITVDDVQAMIQAQRDEQVVNNVKSGDEPRPELEVEPEAEPEVEPEAYSFEDAAVVMEQLDDEVQSPSEPDDLQTSIMAPKSEPTDEDEVMRTESTTTKRPLFNIRGRPSLGKFRKRPQSPARKFSRDQPFVRGERKKTVREKLIEEIYARRSGATTTTPTTTVQAPPQYIKNGRALLMTHANAAALQNAKEIGAIDEDLSSYYSYYDEQSAQREIGQSTDAIYDRISSINGPPLEWEEAIEYQDGGKNNGFEADLGLYYANLPKGKPPGMDYDLSFAKKPHLSSVKFETSEKLEATIRTLNSINRTMTPQSVIRQIQQTLISRSGLPADVRRKLAAYLPTARTLESNFNISGTTAVRPAPIMKSIMAGGIVEDKLAGISRQMQKQRRPRKTNRIDKFLDDRRHSVFRNNRQAIVPGDVFELDRIVRAAEEKKGKKKKKKKKGIKVKPLDFKSDPKVLKAYFKPKLLEAKGSISFMRALWAPQFLYANFEPKLLAPTFYANLLSMDAQPQLLVAQFKPKLLSPEIFASLLSLEWRAGMLRATFDPKLLSPEINMQLLRIDAETPRLLHSENEPKLLSPEIDLQLLLIDPEVELLTQKFSPKLLSPTIKVHLLRVHPTPKLLTISTTPSLLSPTITIDLSAG